MQVSEMRLVPGMPIRYRASCDTVTKEGEVMAQLPGGIVRVAPGGDWRRSVRLKPTDYVNFLPDGGGIAPAHADQYAVKVDGVNVCRWCGKKDGAGLRLKMYSFGAVHDVCYAKMRKWVDRMRHRGMVDPKGVLYEHDEEGRKGYCVGSASEAKKTAVAHGAPCEECRRRPGSVWSQDREEWLCGPCAAADNEREAGTVEAASNSAAGEEIDGVGVGNGVKQPCAKSASEDAEDQGAGAGDVRSGRVVAACALCGEEAGEGESRLLDVEGPGVQVCVRCLESVVLPDGKPLKAERSAREQAMDERLLVEDRLLACTQEFARVVRGARRTVADAEGMVEYMADVLRKIDGVRDSAEGEA